MSERANKPMHKCTNERKSEGKSIVCYLDYFIAKFWKFIQKALIHNSLFFLRFWYFSLQCNFCDFGIICLYRLTNSAILFSFLTSRQCSIFFVFTGLQTGLYFSKEKKKKIIALLSNGILCNCFV